MYRPKTFAVDDAHALDALMDSHPFALIASSGSPGSSEDGAPQLTHAPVLRQGGDELVCHLARPNPHCDVLAAGAPTTIVFSGPHGYVSPRWYAAAHAVPTWNYTAVHVRVAPSEITDTAALAAGMDRMLDHFEDDPAIREIVDAGTIDGMLRGIRGFRLRVLHREGVFKLSQNRSDTDRAGVMNALEAGGPDNAALAACMRALTGDRP